MKYTLEERMEIGRLIHEREISLHAAAASYGINYYTAKTYQRMYREANGIPSTPGHRDGLKPAVKKDASFRGGSMAEYENMTREELIQELVLSKINEARAKKGYVVKGVGAEKEYIVYDSKNTR